LDSFWRFLSNFLLLLTGLMVLALLPVAHGGVVSDKNGSVSMDAL